MDNLIALYKQQLNLQNATFLHINHEDATVAITYKITQSTGNPLILKICTRANDYLHEIYFLKYFAGKLPVPNIIQTIEPRVNIHGAILMEYMPGALIKAEDFTNDLAYEVGLILARIHMNRATGYGDLTQPHDLKPDPRVYFTMKFEEGLLECINHLPKELIEQCRDYYYKYIHLLNSVDGPCIAHRDFRAGNVIAYNNKVMGIIDWSSARASFAEEDFCFLEHGDWPINPDNKKYFLQGYASIRTVPDYNAIMPLLRLNRAIAIIGFAIKRRTWKSSMAAKY